MICAKCREAADKNKPKKHRQCKGGTHCDCQCRVEKK